jgi:cob(I)alamin adenosyltransferase
MSFKIYTKTGDGGQTSLFGGARVPKYHLRIETYGTVDELNSYIGAVRDGIALSDTRSHEVLLEIQKRLFVIGANLAADPKKNMTVPDLLESDVKLLEDEIDRMDEQLPALKNFILPGGHPTVSTCHVARCVCRRAERLAVHLALDEPPVADIVIHYLNRLSDYLFTLSRQLAQDFGAEEIPWTSR